MTQHVTHLLNDLIGRVSQAEHGADEEAVQHAKAKLVAYIEELERKAKAYDDREKHPFPPPHPGTRRNA